MAVRSKELGSGTMVVPGGGIILYTCPANRTAIVKSAALVNLGLNGRVSAYVRRPLVADFVFIYEQVPGGEARYVECWVVLEPGDSLHLTTDPPALARGYFSGAELIGVAP